MSDVWWLFKRKEKGFRACPKTSRGVATIVISEKLSLDPVIVLKCLDELEEEGKVGKNKWGVE